MTLILTEEMIRRGANGTAGWCAAQMRILGVAWPQPKGWLRDLIGTEIGEETYRAFLAARKQKDAIEKLKHRAQVVRRHRGCAEKDLEALAQVGAGDELRGLADYIARLLAELKG